MVITTNQMFITKHKRSALLYRKSAQTKLSFKTNVIEGEEAVAFVCNFWLCAAGTARSACSGVRGCGRRGAIAQGANVRGLCSYEGPTKGHMHSPPVVHATLTGIHACRTRYTPRNTSL